MSDQPVTRFSYQVETYARDKFQRAQGAFQRGDIATGEQELEDMRQTFGDPRTRQKLEFIAANAEQSPDENLRRFGTTVARSILNGDYETHIPRDLRSPATNPNYVQFASSRSLMNPDAARIIQHTVSAPGSDAFLETVVGRMKSMTGQAAPTKSDGKEYPDFESSGANRLASATMRHRANYTSWLTGLSLDDRNADPGRGRIVMGQDGYTEKRNLFKANETRFASDFAEGMAALTELGADEAFISRLQATVDTATERYAGNARLHMEARSEAFKTLALAAKDAADAGLGSGFAQSLWEGVSKDLPATGFAGSGEYVSTALRKFGTVLQEAKLAVNGDMERARALVAEAAKMKDPEAQADLVQEAQMLARPLATHEDVHSALDMARSTGSRTGEDMTTRFANALRARVRARGEYSDVADSPEQVDTLAQIMSEEELNGIAADEENTTRRTGIAYLRQGLKMKTRSEYASDTLSVFIDRLAKNAELNAVTTGEAQPSSSMLDREAAEMVRQGLATSTLSAKTYLQEAYQAVQDETYGANLPTGQRLQAFLIRRDQTPRTAGDFAISAHNTLMARGQMIDTQKAVATLAKTLKDRISLYGNVPQAKVEIDRAVAVLQDPRLAPSTPAEVEQLSMVAERNATLAVQAKEQKGSRGNALGAVVAAESFEPVEAPYLMMRKRGFDAAKVVDVLDTLYGPSPAHFTMVARAKMADDPGAAKDLAKKFVEASTTMPSPDNFAQLFDFMNRGRVLGETVRMVMPGEPGFVEQKGNLERLLKKELDVPRDTRKLWLAAYDQMIKSR